jgi:UDP-glucose 4-epimerase
MTTHNSPPHPSRILVTGAFGYLGSQLLRDLVNSADTNAVAIRALDNTHRGSVRALFDLPSSPGVEFIEGDIMDPLAVREALTNVDAVVHLAALVRTPMSHDNPIWAEQVNHWGTARLVESCLEAGVRRFVYSSTAAVYGPGGPFRETDRARPVGHYAQSKRNAELAVDIAVDRGLQPVVLRFGSLYGTSPALRLDAVVNQLTYLAGIGRPLPVHGAGEQRRPSVHVRDASSAVQLALQIPWSQDQHMFNVVADNPSVNQIVESIRDLRPTVEVRPTEQDTPLHISIEVDGGLLRLQGWEPQHSVRDGIEELLTRLSGLHPPKVSRTLQSPHSSPVV